jgi:hypothetical protein
MLHYFENKKLFAKPVLLDEDCEPLEIIDAVLLDYPLQDIKFRLWELITVALTSENDEYNDPQPRSNLLYFWSRLEMLLEAAWMANEAHKQTSKGD